MIVVTDMTRRVEEMPIVADYSREYRTALMSVPALGATRQRKRAEDVLVHLMALYVDRDSAHEMAASGLVREFQAEDEEVQRSFADHLALFGPRGRLRLLSGMVRANQPWLLVPKLSPALAGAAAGAAFGVFYSNIWMLADAFTTLRLLVVAGLALFGMTIWLIADNSLWERPRDHQLREEARLYNVSTVVTISLAVFYVYLLLFVVTLGACLAVIPGSYFTTTIGHSAGFIDYVRLAWLCASMGAMAGALGSGFAGEDTVRRAAYGTRSMERRKRLAEQDSE